MGRTSSKDMADKQRDELSKQLKTLSDSSFTSLSVPLALKSTGVYQSQSPNDVNIVFNSTGGTQLELWASSELLKAVSPYFKVMLDSGMQESQDVVVVGSSTTPAKRKASVLDRDSIPSVGEAHPSTLNRTAGQGGSEAESLVDEDSDNEADEIYAQQGESSEQVKSTSSSTGPPFKRVNVTHAKYATYVAFLSWLQTGRITVAPLKSSFASSAARIEPLRQAILHNPLEPIPVSAKSTYKLAKYLDIPSLAAIALEQYVDMIEVRLAADEVFGPMLGFDDAKARLAKFVTSNKREVKLAGGPAAVKARVAKGECAGVEAEVIEILADLI